MNSFDLFSENSEKNIKVFTQKDLKFLKSIIDITNIFLKNAINENNFESLINSFYKLKDKLELNNFVSHDNISISVTRGYAGYDDKKSYMLLIMGFCDV